MCDPSHFPAVGPLVAAIHQAAVPTVLSVTGGGSGAISALLGVPGASRTVLEAVIPYSSSALMDWLGKVPEQFCSGRTARAMAMRSFARAGQLLGTVANPDGGARWIGIGCTASLASDRPKRGAHRIHLAAQTPRSTVEWSVELEKGARSRADEEALAARLVLNLLAATCGAGNQVPLELRDTEPLAARSIDAPPAWQRVLLGAETAVCHPQPGCWQPPRCLFPGAFDPLHEGHRRMAQLAEQRTGLPVDFELSIHNVDKPPLDYLEVESRLAAFDAGQRVWLTSAPTFAEKSERFPGATFVVGADTLLRIADDKYCGNQPAARDAAIAGIAGRGCRFLVFGRLADGTFATLSRLQLPAALAQLCAEVGPEEFRTDISSTILRQAARPRADD